MSRKKSKGTPWSAERRKQYAEKRRVQEKVSKADHGSREEKEALQELDAIEEQARSQPAADNYDPADDPIVERANREMLRNQRRMFEGLVELPFTYLARRVHPKWALRPDERTSIADASAAVASVYAPAMAHWFPLIYLCSTVGMVVADRMMMEDGTEPARAGDAAAGNSPPAPPFDTDGRLPAAGSVRQTVRPIFSTPK